MAVNEPKRNYKNPVACASAFGRFFYAVDSFVYYSQVLTSVNDSGKCYQRNDPTSSEIPDLLDTDGGFIELEDSRKIKAMEPFRAGVLVFAGNGVWHISGPETGFTATNYRVDKISERGIDSPRSIVAAENTIYYFSNNGIMRVESNQFGKVEVVDLTEDTIRSKYLIAYVGKDAEGVYDEGNKQCVWWIPNTQSDGLVYDIRLNAFYPQNNASRDWKIKRPFTIVNASYYTSAKDSNDSVEYSFAIPASRSFKDFGDDQTAYLITGYETLGKFGNSKSVTQAKVFFRKTETQILNYSEGEFAYDYPSSCLFQARWDFDDTDAGNRFVGRTGVTGSGKKVQLYRPLRRPFIPSEYPADFDTGQSVISTKYNILGSGDGVQLVFKAEPEKDLQLLGYTINYKMKGRM